MRVANACDACITFAFCSVLNVGTTQVSCNSSVSHCTRIGVQLCVFCVSFQLQGLAAAMPFSCTVFQLVCQAVQRKCIRRANIELVVNAPCKFYSVSSSLGQTHLTPPISEDQLVCAVASAWRSPSCWTSTCAAPGRDEH